VGIVEYRVLCPAHFSDNVDEHDEGAGFGVRLKAPNMFSAR
jgi:hypothetical protein